MLMDTDSEALLHAGNDLAARTWAGLLEELGWGAQEVERVITHQVGAAHRRLLLETLGIDGERDYPTVDRLGNIGSVSLPITFDLAQRAGESGPMHHLACFFKQPLDVKAHDLHEQWHVLTRYVADHREK